MAKLAVLFHLLGATVLSGVFLLIVLVTPALSENAFRWLPIAVGAGVIAAIPPSVWAARKVLAKTRGV